MRIDLKYLWRVVFTVSLILLLTTGIGDHSVVYAQGDPTLTIASNIPATAGAQVDVPVMYTSNGAQIATFAFSLNYNDSCLSFDPTDADENGIPDNVLSSLPAGFSLGVSYDGTDIDSELDFSVLKLASVLTPMPDSTLLTVTFDVLPDCPGTNAAVLFSNAPKASFGDVNAVSIPGTTVSGSVQIGGWTLSGNVYYQQNTEKPVSGVTMDLTGAGTDQTTTDTNGEYSFLNSTSGSYTVTPSLSGQVNGISSFDAAYIAQCVAGLRNLADCPLLAADTSGNSALSSFDAALIARYAAGLGGSSRVGTWVFDPSEQTHPNLSGTLTDQDFAAYLVGEVTGNWQSPATPATE